MTQPLSRKALVRAIATLFEVAEETRAMVERGEQMPHEASFDRGYAEGQLRGIALTLGEPVELLRADAFELIQARKTTS